MLRWNNGKTNLLVPKAPAAGHLSNRKERENNISMIWTSPYLAAALRWSWHSLPPLQPLRASRSCTVQTHNLCALSSQLFSHTLQRLLRCRLFSQWLCSDCRWRLWSWWTLGRSYWWRCWSVFCRSWLDLLALSLKQRTKRIMFQSIQLPLTLDDFSSNNSLFIFSLSVNLDSEELYFLKMIINKTKVAHFKILW